MTKPTLRYLNIVLVSLIGLCSPYTGAEKKLFFVVPDHLGTPKYLVDENQTVVWDNNAKPFGNSTPNQDPDGDGQAVELNHRFPGQYYDEETGLHYNYFRCYDPTLGRYITSDPIGLNGGMNTYGYAGSNPIKYMDPLGLYFGIDPFPTQADRQAFYESMRDLRNMPPLGDLISTPNGNLVDSFNQQDGVRT